MTTYRRNSGDGLRALFRDLTHGRRFNRGAAWGMIILVALLAFEVSNFNATRFALRDILGDLSFGGLQWATILAIAFCGIDFAGIARVFTPEQGADEPKEVGRATFRQPSRPTRDSPAPGGPSRRSAE